MKYQILVVDDSKLARMALKKILKTLHPDWVVVEAANADEARHSMQEIASDVALVDFNMPGSDGLELAAELRKFHPHMPVGVVSANHQEAVISRAKAQGAQFLPKPVTEQTLSSFLDDAVQRLASGA